jgi:hypothetical protein
MRIIINRNIGSFSDSRWSWVVYERHLATALGLTPNVTAAAGPTQSPIGRESKRISRTIRGEDKKTKKGNENRHETRGSDVGAQSSTDLLSVKLLVIGGHP